MFRASFATLLSRAPFSTKFVRSIKTEKIQNVRKSPGVPRVFSRATLLVETGSHWSPSTATNHSRTRDEAPARAFFLFVSKGFSEAIRLSETGHWPEIVLRTTRVSFHPPFTKIETHSKMFVFSDACRKRVAPQLKRARPLSMRTETPEGGVVVRVGAKP